VNLTLEMPEDLAQRLAQIAAAEHRTIQDVAVERLPASVTNCEEDGLEARLPVCCAR
jgi:hypothetical protein